MKEIQREKEAKEIGSNQAAFGNTVLLFSLQFYIHPPIIHLGTSVRSVLFPVKCMLTQLNFIKEHTFTVLYYALLIKVFNEVSLLLSA